VDSDGPEVGIVAMDIEGGAPVGKEPMIFSELPDAAVLARALRLNLGGSTARFTMTGATFDKEAAMIDWGDASASGDHIRTREVQHRPAGHRGGHRD
jgi:hypothetical protein